MPLSVAIAGASGYAGSELLRLLAGHPEFVVTTVTAHSSAGELLGAVHPHLRTYANLIFAETSTETLAGHDVVFLALPHGKSGEIAATLPAETLVIDCGADHRLADPADWAAFYGGPFFEPWTYGMPELVRADGTTQRSHLAGAKRIAVPGCNATAVTLGLAPGIRAGLLEPDDIVAVLAVGTSGAGKALSTDLLASEILGSASAYKVGGIHRHVPEIRQNFALGGVSNVSLSFTPVLVPMARGILATSTAKLRKPGTAKSVREAFQLAYENEPFVYLLPEGQFPKSSDTLGANTALIGIAVDKAAGRVVTITALDNLVKGTAGAAIQSANIALGFDETVGLAIDGVAP